MRAYDNGCYFTVNCSGSDVQAFANRWPCFGTVKRYWFQFHKLTGDLVDTNHEDGETDGSGIVALADDAKAYGEQQLRGAIAAVRHHPHNFRNPANPINKGEGSAS